MNESLGNFFKAIGMSGRRVLLLALPYGRGKIVLVLFFSLLQGLFQVVGVSALFPFLALVVNPAGFRMSAGGAWLLGHFPTVDDAALIWWAGLLAVASLLASNLVNMIAELHRARYALGFAEWLRARLLRQMVARPYAAFLHDNSSVLLKKINADVMLYANGVLLPLLECLGNAVTAVLLFATLLWFSPLVALGCAVFFGLFYLLSFRFFASKRRAFSQGLKRAERGAMHEVNQLLSGIKPIKVNLVEELFLTRFEQHAHQQSRLMSRMPLLQSGPRYLMELLAFGGLVLLVVVAGGRGQSFSMILPNLGVVALAGYRLLPAIQMIYGKLTHISTMRYALDEVYEEFVAGGQVAEAAGTVNDEPFSRPPALVWSREIRLENLSFRYPGAEREIISNLSLSITKNSSLGIIGPSGCGKSTLVDLLLGLQSPSSGRILCDGRSLTVASRRAWSRGIGYVPQEIFLIDDTVAANIAFGLPADSVDPAALRRAARSARILDFIEEELPQGFQSKVGERGVRLSGGQRQRIGLARALYDQPSLLIFDEATSALDLTTEGEVIEAMRCIQGTVTMIIVAHRPSTVAPCDQILDFAKSPSPGLAGAGRPDRGGLS